MEKYPLLPTGGSCCAGKAVWLGHYVTSLTHLADDVPIRNYDIVLPLDFSDFKETIVVGRSTRVARSVQTKVIPLTNY